MTSLDTSEALVPIGDATIFVRRHLTPRTSVRPSRPTMIFLHDSLGCADTWRDFPRGLAERVGLEALVYDRQGYGRSSPFGSEPRTPQYLEHEASVLRTLLDVYEIETAVLFGHSDGGSIALIAASVAPDRIDAVVTEGAHVFVEELTLRGIRAAREMVATTDLSARLARYHGDKVPAILEAWIDTWLSEEFRSWNIESFLSGIRCPLLIVQGENDEFGTLEQVTAIVKGVGAHAEALIIPGIGHTPHRDAQSTVLAAATEFIDGALRHQ